MMKDTLYQELTMLIYTVLQLDCPVMSGNMQEHINYEQVEDDFSRISISAPSYDVEWWKRTKQIEYTGEYDYAVSVNNVGAFMGKSTKSKHWVNKSIVKACEAIAPSYNAEVIVDVEL